MEAESQGEISHSLKEIDAEKATGCLLQEALTFQKIEVAAVLAISEQLVESRSPTPQQGPARRHGPYKGAGLFHSVAIKLSWRGGFFECNSCGQADTPPEAISPLIKITSAGLILGKMACLLFPSRLAMTEKSFAWDRETFNKAIDSS